MIRRASVFMITASLALLAAPLATAQTIPVWVRAAGVADENVGEPKPLFVVDLDALSLQTTARFDPQYGRVLEFLGTPLRTLLERDEVPSSVDLALLHFGRGMVVPLQFRDKKLMQRLDLFLARSARLPGSSSFVRGTFLPIPQSENPMSVVFGGNKVVTSAASDNTQKPIFAPWRWVDSLVTIELVESEAYFAQFDVAPDDERAHRGFSSFKDSCQHCHGVRGVGAAYGPDFVDPTPAYRRFGRDERLPNPTPSLAKPLRPNPYLPRKQIDRIRRDNAARERAASEPYQHWRRSLYAHVKFGPLGRKREGAAMPQLSFITEEDGALLWDWLRAVAREPLRRYAPRGPGVDSPAN